MRADKKGKRTWLYLTEEDEGHLEKLVANTRLSHAFVMSELASAALAAVARAYELKFPLKFTVCESRFELNDPKPPYPKPRK